MKTRSMSFGVVLMVLGASALAESPTPFVGTWKLNVAKSTYSPGPPPRSFTHKNEVVENGVRAVSEGIDADGKPFKVEWTAKFDGKDHPYVGSPTADSISLEKVDDYTTEWKTKKGGKVVSSGRTVYSRDGKLRTNTWSGTNAKGEKVTATAVFERQ